MQYTIPLFKRLLILIQTLVLFNISANGQASYPQNDFISPLEIPLYLAGNFGELRSNHFHSGIDIKTQGREGLNVLVAADGYVSRIKVSPFGYGKAIYVRHSNGYTTVYAHLKSFGPVIDAFVKKQQYAQKSFKVELYPSANQFRLKQGDMIGISGNSGGSVAPHLHFEIRETASEKPVNPLLFGFEIKDDLPPILTELHIYPLNSEVQINGKNGRRSFIINGSNGNYTLPPSINIEASGPFYLGLKMHDKLNEMHNKCGIYEVDLFHENELIYHHRIEKFTFKESRYLNALVDYEQKMKKNKWIHKSYILPNNRLSIYGNEIKNGIINPSKEPSNLNYVIRDVYGNQSTLNLKTILVDPRINGSATLSQKPIKKFKYNQANSFESENVLVYLPSNVLYEDLDFNFWIDDTIENAIAPLYHIHDLFTPLHSYMAVSIKLDKIPTSIRKYCMVVSLDEDGKVVQEGGYWKGDYIIVKTRSFGDYTVMVDSMPPKLTPINIKPNAYMTNKWSIMIKAEDNLSGVDKYDAYIDDRWVLLEFDYKKKRLIHYFEDDLAKGKHKFKIVVKDKIGNSSQYEAEFSR